MQLYQQPQQAATGQMIGRAYLTQFIDNRELFGGIIDRWRCVPEAVNRSFVAHENWTGDSDEWPPIWDGYHYLKSNAQLLHYYWGATTASGFKVLLSMYYGGILIAEYNSTATTSTHNANSLESATIDLSTTDFVNTGMNRLYITAQRFKKSSTGPGWDSLGGSDDSGRVYIAAPYTTYTSTDTSYARLDDQIETGDTGTAAEFNQLRTNGAHFYANLPPQPAFIRRRGKIIGTEQGRTLWSGRVTYYGTRLYYKVGIAKVGNDHTDIAYSIKIYHLSGNQTTSNTQPIRTIGPNGVSGYTYNCDSDGLAEGYIDSLPGNTGNDYRVEVRFTRESDKVHTVSPVGTVYYMYTAPPSAFPYFTWQSKSALAVFSTMTAATINAMFTNDANIASYLHRKDFAIRDNRWKELGSDMRVDFQFIRRYNLLYYRGTDIRVSWGVDGSATLTDIAGTDEIGVFDLNSATGLHPGMHYVLEGGVIEFAQEYPS